MDETPIKITITDTVITARLADNATARDLAAQLPLTLTFIDFNHVEGCDTSSAAVYGRRTSRSRPRHR